MQREIKFKEHALIALGTFNPATFQPWWFSANGLVGAGEADAATVKVIHSSATQITMGMLDIQVTSNRMSVLTSDESRWESARDLVINTFKKMRHTPLKAIGINVAVHFRVKDSAEWHAIGHKIAPKTEIWSKVLKNPGMKTLTISGEHEPEFPGFTNIKIEPSVLFKPDGIFIDVNDHYNLTDKTTGKPGNGLTLSELVEKRWKHATDNANATIAKLIEIL